MSPNLDLFGQPIDNKPIRIIASHNTAQLTKAQKAFNTLIKQIENKRIQLLAWEVTTTNFQQKFTLNLAPLIEKIIDIKTEIVLRLDLACSQKGFSKIECSLIEDLIVDLAESVLAERNDEHIKAVYDKYHTITYDQQNAAELAQIKSLLEAATGLDLDDELDISDREAVLKHIQEQMSAQTAAEESRRAEQAEHQSKRRKSSKQIAREQKLHAEAQHTSQSLREIYRKLASALHPDRETDPEERKRKTALMQRVNQAHENGNLLQLLELQLELEHITPTALSNLDEERLLRYNSILKEQLKELSDEITQVQDNFHMRFGINPNIKVSPSSALHLLAHDITNTQHDINELKRDLAALQDIKTTKSWLKKMQRWNNDMDFYER